jgi:hypothetical protein
MCRRYLLLDKMLCGSEITACKISSAWASAMNREAGMVGDLTGQLAWAQIRPLERRF